LASVQLANAGDYSVIVSNTAGHTVSPEARLIVYPPLQFESSARFEAGQFDLSTRDSKDELGAQVATMPKAA
jgi:hypothetical protein